MKSQECREKFVLPGYPMWFLIFAIPLVLSTYSLLWVLFFVIGNLFVKISLIAILIITVNYFRNNNVRNAVFYDKEICITYSFGKKLVKEYSEVKKIVENREGFLPITVNLIYFQGRKKYTYFYCPESKRKDLDEFLKTKGLKIRPQP